MAEKNTQNTKLKILPPKVDVVFKLLFGDERNKDILIDFLKSVLSLGEDEYAEIYVTDPHIKRERVKDKLGIVDVKLRTVSGKIIHIEIQVLEQDEMPERSAYYNDKMFVSQLKSGDKYWELKQTISIIITDFDMIKSDKIYRHKFMMSDIETKTVLTEMQIIYSLELSKLPEKSDNTRLYNWLEFLKSEEEAEFDMIATKSPVIGKAVTELKRLSQSEKARMLYEDREKALRDEESRLHTAINKGRAEGKVEGRAEGKQEKAIEMVKEMLSDGEPINKIIRYSKLSEDEINDIAKQMQIQV